MGLRERSTYCLNIFESYSSFVGNTINRNRLMSTRVRSLATALYVSFAQPRWMSTTSLARHIVTIASQSRVLIYNAHFGPFAMPIFPEPGSVWTERFTGVQQNGK